MWQVGSNCYSTTTEALNASASSESGKVVSHAGSAHVVTVVSVGPDSVEYKLNPLAGGTSTLITVPQTPLSCGLLTVADGQLIGWAIAAGWIGVFLIKSLLFARPE